MPARELSASALKSKSNWWERPLWAKRNKKGGQFIAEKKSPKKFKGVRGEKKVA